MIQSSGVSSSTLSGRGRERCQNRSPKSELMGSMKRGPNYKLKNKKIVDRNDKDRDHSRSFSFKCPKYRLFPPLYISERWWENCETSGTTKKCIKGTLLESENTGCLLNRRRSSRTISATFRRITNWLRNTEGSWSRSDQDCPNGKDAERENVGRGTPYRLLWV